MSIKQEIIEAVQSLKPDHEITDVIWDMNLMDIGITSIQFIQLLVVIEAKCGVEFPDEALNIEMLPTLAKIGEFVTALKGMDQ